MAEQADLRRWIDVMRSLDEINVISGADPETEIGAISEHNVRQPRHRALLFEAVPGYDAGQRLLTCSTGSPVRLGHTFRLGEGHDDASLVAALRGKPAQWAAAASRYAPRVVRDGPALARCQRGSDVDLKRFVAPLWHELDGGRYLGTGAVGVTRDPETGVCNVGVYRMMLHDDGSLTVLMVAGKHGSLNCRRWWDRGELCPIVISLGHDPLLLCLGGTEVPTGLSELDYYGAVCGEPLEVVESDISGLPFPAASEVVIEGFLDPQRLAAEGPFGEWRGYYTYSHRAVPTVQVQRVWHRDDPICLGAPAGLPPFDFSYFRCVFKSAMIHDALTDAGLPEVRGVWCHEAGGGRMLTVVSIRQRYCGHARQAGFLACQLEAAAYGGRYVIVVDEDIDPRNLEEVLWAVCTRSEPSEDIDFVRKAWGSPGEPLCRDPERPYNSRAVIDACMPYERLANFPPVARMSVERQQQVAKKWAWLWSNPERVPTRR